MHCENNYDKEKDTLCNQRLLEENTLVIPFIFATSWLVHVHFFSLHLNSAVQRDSSYSATTLSLLLLLIYFMQLKNMLSEARAQLAEERCHILKSVRLSATI